MRWHLKNLFEKTGYFNRVSLACDVIDKDLIVPGVQGVVIISHVLPTFCRFRPCRCKNAPCAFENYHFQ